MFAADGEVYIDNHFSNIIYFLVVCLLVGEWSKEWCVRPLLDRRMKVDFLVLLLTVVFLFDFLALVFFLCTREEEWATRLTFLVLVVVSFLQCERELFWEVVPFE